MAKVDMVKDKQSNLDDSDLPRFGTQIDVAVTKEESGDLQKVKMVRSHLEPPVESEM